MVAAERIKEDEEEYIYYLWSPTLVLEIHLSEKSSPSFSSPSLGEGWHVWCMPGMNMARKYIFKRRVGEIKK